MLLLNVSNIRGICEKISDISVLMNNNLAYLI